MLNDQHVADLLSKPSPFQAPDFASSVALSEGVRLLAQRPKLAVRLIEQNWRLVWLADIMAQGCEKHDSQLNV